MIKKKSSQQENGLLLARGDSMNNMLLQYREFAKDPNLPSLRDSFSSKKRPEARRIVKYLRSGKIALAAAGCATDFVTGEMIPGTLYIQNDGEYTWSSPLAYYVEKYNLQLPIEFEKKALERVKY